MNASILCVFHIYQENDGFVNLRLWIISIKYHQKKYEKKTNLDKEKWMVEKEKIIVLKEL